MTWWLPAFQIRSITDRHWGECVLYWCTGVCLWSCLRWETIVLISMYGIYIIIMKWVCFSSPHISITHKYQPATATKPTVSLCVCRFNQSLCSLVERHCSRAGQPCLSGLRRTTAVGHIGDCDNDMVPLKPGAGACVCTCACVHHSSGSTFSL